VTCGYSPRGFPGRTERELPTIALESITLGETIFTASCIGIPDDRHLARALSMLEGRARDSRVS
jgi:hypothetical protein